MSKRSGAVHVAKVSKRSKGKVYVSHLLRRTYRHEGKVKHETLGNISHLPDNIIEMIRAALRGEELVPVASLFNCVRSLPHGHVSLVRGALRKLELERIIASRPCRMRDLVTAMIVARIVDPRSKLATARGLSRETAFSSLGHVLSVDDTTEDELYAAMDWLHEKQCRIETKLAARHLTDNTLVLYDLTSSYFEGRKCPLAAIGHNRDGKKNKLQIVFGVLCTKQGCPIAVEVFSGNTADPKTVAPQILKLRERFGLERVVMVGDRGMLTEARIRDDLQTTEGISWISALRAPAIKKLIAEGDLGQSLFDETDIAEIHSPAFPGERLVACFNPLLAAERSRKRQDLLEATDKELQKIQAATDRASRPLRGKDKIGIRVGKMLNKYRVGKHYNITITENSFTWQRDENRIAEEEKLDGIYIIRTDVPEDVLDAAETVGAYKSLALVERVFRTMKTIDLRVRPIHHYTEDRVRCHVFLCMLAYYVEWHMRQELAPILFDDDDKETARRMRKSEVAPAKRSPRALAKASQKRTEDDAPVHSFRTLLADLGTIVLNFIEPDGTSSAFTVITQPTPVQRRAFELLGLTVPS